MNLSESIFLTSPGTAIVVDTLRAAKKSLADPRQWTGRGGDSCIVMAITATGATPMVMFEACKKILAAIEIPWWDLSHIYAWNDNPLRTHAEVMATFDRAIELAR